MAAGPRAAAGVVGRCGGYGVRRRGALHPAVQRHPANPERRGLLHLRLPGVAGRKHFADTFLVSGVCLCACPVLKALLAVKLWFRIFEEMCFT